MGTPLNIEFRDVSRAWDEHIAIRGLNLQISPGERIALIGPSGSGKTTLLRLAMGALTSTEGRVVVGGNEIAALSIRDLRAYRRRVHLLEQAPERLPSMTVHQTVIAGRLPTWPVWKGALAAIARVGADEVCACLSRVRLADRQWETW